MKELDPNRALPAITATRMQREQQQEWIRRVPSNGWLSHAADVVRAAKGEVVVSVEGIAQAKTVLAQTPADPENPGKLLFEKRHAQATIDVFFHLPMRRQGEILHDGGEIVFDLNGFKAR